MGAAQAGMGLAAGDLESDGLADIFVTNFQKDASTLYRNLGNFIFEDITRNLRIDKPTFALLSWGTTLSDFDQDGDLDSFVANGHIYPQADLVPAISGGFRQPNLMLINDGDTFMDVTARAGPGLTVIEASHGLVVGDLDFDGDLDMALSNVDAAPTVLRNDTESAGAWLLVDAPGAIRVEADAGDLHLVRHRVVGASFLSVNDPRHHFGLARARNVDGLKLIWSDGFERQYRALPVDRQLNIVR